MQDEDLTIPRPIEFCTGSFAAIRTDVFKTIGGFDPEYFMYVEDADLTQRALRQGLVYLLPQFTATHAWHRDPMRDAGKFKMQLKSMGRYFKNGASARGMCKRVIVSAKTLALIETAGVHIVRTCRLFFVISQI